MFDCDESESKICKNCERFREPDWGGRGRCKIELPPFVLIDHRNTDQEVYNHDTCSFFKGKN